jgi:hypothetical protein
MLVAAAFVGAAACGGNVVVDGIGGSSGLGGQTGSGGTLAISCDVVSGGVHVCAEIDNPTPTEVSNLTGMCVGSMTTLGTGCPSANRLGTCTVSAGAPSATAPATQPEVTRGIIRCSRVAAQHATGRCPLHPSYYIVGSAARRSAGQKPGSSPITIESPFLGTSGGTARN